MQTQTNYFGPGDDENVEEGTDTGSGGENEDVEEGADTGSGGASEDHSEEADADSPPIDHTENPDA